MKVMINTDGHCVEIESTDEGMTVHRLANIAINTWRRTAPAKGDQPAFGLAGNQVAVRSNGYALMHYGERPEVNSVGNRVGS